MLVLVTVIVRLSPALLGSMEWWWEREILLSEMRLPFQFPVTITSNHNMSLGPGELLQADFVKGKVTEKERHREDLPFLVHSPNVHSGRDCASLKPGTKSFFQSPTWLQERKD